MKRFLHLGACLVAATIAAPPAHVLAQSPEPAAPKRAEANQSGTEAREGGQAEPEPARKPRKGRKNRAPRDSRRTAPLPQPTFDEGRTSRVAGPTRQELTLTANLQGGYDDNLTAGLGGSAGSQQMAMASGSTAFTDATLGFFRGNNLRSLRVDATGNLRAYPGYVDQPAAGGSVNVGGRTRVGRELTIGASERVGYEPYFNVFSTGSSAAPAGGMGDALPAAGLFERRSLTSNSSVSADRRWGRRNWTSASYSYSLQQFTDGERGDSTSHRVSADYRRSLGRGTRARAEYRYSRRDYTGSDLASLPMREHRLEAGPEFEQVLSRTRQFTVSFSAGATYVESVTARTRQPYDGWVPVGSASVVVGLSPLWSVGGGYDRDFSQLRGITDELYTTDTAYATTGGRLAPRTDLRLGATYSSWVTPMRSGVNERLAVYGGSVQLRFALTRKVGVTGDYYYYHHRFSDPGALPPGFPSKYGRNAVRVGISIWAPLVGTPAQPALAPR